MTEATAAYLRTLGRLIAVVAVGLWFLVLVDPHASAAPAPSSLATTSATTTSSAKCPSGASCATIPQRCPKGTVCPEVIISPATSLGVNQWVFISVKHFNPGDPVDIYFCTDRHPLAKGGPLCMLEANPEILNPEVALTASPGGTASISFETEEDANDGNQPLDGEVPGTQISGGFFCDNSPDPCSIDVADPLLHDGGTINFHLTPQNATVVPITFQKATGGCPRASFVQTASEFGIDRIFPIAAEYDCKGSAPAIGVNTASDSLSAVTSVAGGASQMAFIDDPDSPDVQAELATLNTGSEPGYVLIPVALSAIDIAFKATMAASLSGLIYPDNSYRLTPNMVAGLITDYYAYASGADVANCGHAFGGQCSLMFEINTQSGFRGPGQFGGYVRADATSSTGEVFDWICHAPRVPVHLGTRKIRETPAGKVLVAGLRQGGDTKVSKCPETDVFPPLLNTFAWVAGSNPSVQTSNLASFVAPPNSSLAAEAGFAPMNASEANYYGLLPAALQNAAGKFVLPTPRSLDAAVAGAVRHPNGTLTPDFRDKNPKAYPLPDIWYAVVPTGDETATTVAAQRTLLDNVLRLTSSSQLSSLVPGFVPLPTSLKQQAEREIARLVTTAVPPTTTTTTLPVTTTTQPKVTPTTSAKVTPTTQPKVTNTTAPKAPVTTRAFQTTAFSVAGQSDSWLAPAFVSVVAGALLFGPGLLLKTRRRAGRAT